MKILFSSFVLIITSHFLNAQDKVLLKNGDTLNVVIPADPKKETDLSNSVIGDMNDYGFRSVVVIYNKDSIRIQMPNEIKGYIREKNGDYLGSGYFESRVINEKQIGYKYDNTRAVFLQRVNFHKEVTIWYYREDLGEPLPRSYFLIQLANEDFMILITSYKQWAQWSVNYPPLGELTSNKPKPKNGKKREGQLFQYLVQIMDTYKEKYP
jgi:hypothetical protein